MEERFQKIREYSFGDFWKVLCACFVRAAVCTLIVALLLGGSLGCLAVFVTHDEYAATIAKVDDTYDVPIIPATMRARIYDVLRKKYTENELSENELLALSGEIDQRLSVTEESEGLFKFTLSSFNSSTKNLSGKDLKSILWEIVNYYGDTYASKIMAKYTVKASTEAGSTLAEMKNLNYYLQTEVLNSFLDSTIEEIQTVASKTFDVEENRPVVSLRSDFAAYLCPENNRRVSDTLLSLKNLYMEIAYTQSYICRNGIEKAGTNPMEDYINGQLQTNPNSEKWLGVKEQWSSTQTPATQQQIKTAEKLIDDIVQSVNNILLEYNKIAKSYSHYIMSDYVIISVLSETVNIGAVDWFMVVLITTAGALIAFLICYLLQFIKMQKSGEIGVELIEGKEE
ncbi:MAG: hypothetical protein IJY26_02790 [Clostridia bacterium]|nr:hypothetical protein [Clostridia bacterium]